MWIQDEGIPPLVWYHPGLEHNQVGRHGRLDRDKAEHFKLARRKTYDTHLNLQPPVASRYIVSTNLYQLLQMNPEFLL